MKFLRGRGFETQTFFVEDDRATPKVCWLRGILCTVLALQAICYGVMSPLLPRMVEDFGLAEPQAGLLIGSFTIGMLVACICLLSLRQPPSSFQVVTLGIVLLSIGCLGIASLSSYLSIVVARLLMGCGAGLCFAGGVRWLVRLGPGKEGFYFGLGWGMLSVGNAVGPLLGSLALTVGSAALHINLALLFLGALTATWLLGRKYNEHASKHQAKLPKTKAGVWHMFRRQEFLAALAPMIAPAIAIGLLFTLVPLRLATEDFQMLVGPAFAISAVAGAVSGPLFGHLLLTIKHRSLTFSGLVVGAVMLVAAGWPIGPWLLVFVTVIVLGVTNQAVVVSSSDRLRQIGEKLGADVSATAVPLMFAIFETAGALLGGLTSTFGAPIPYLGAAVISLLCIFALRGHKPHQYPEHSTL